MVYKLLFDDKVVKDLKRIDKHQQKKILHTIKTKLTSTSSNPYLGKRLVGELSPYFSMRIGSYRVIYEIIEEQVIITVINIKHRKEVYRKS